MQNITSTYLFYYLKYHSMNYTIHNYLYPHPKHNGTWIPLVPGKPILGNVPHGARMPRTGSLVPGQPIEVMFLLVRVCRVPVVWYLASQLK
jgi:hypothetical protein